MVTTDVNRCYIVEKSAIAHNIRTLQQFAEHAKIYAVVKADGYGLGCGAMVALCGACGIRDFAVTDLSGAEAVMGSGVAVDELLLLSPADPRQIPRLLELGVTFTVASQWDIENLLPWKPKVHIKVDTGMGRRGFLADQPSQIAELYAKYPQLQYTGIYTHFSDGSDIRTAKKQFLRFQHLLRVLDAAGIDPGIRHCCNSAAVFGDKTMHLDGIRVGSALLGRIPNGKRFGLRRTGICRVAVEAVKKLPRGAAVGYGAVFHTKRETTVALCPIGTHNGFGVTSVPGMRDLLAAGRDTARWLFGRWNGHGLPHGYVNGKECRVFGRISTEMTVLDVTNVDCTVGDMVEFEINPMLLHDIPVVFAE